MEKKIIELSSKRRAKAEIKREVSCSKLGSLRMRFGRRQTLVH